MSGGAHFSEPFPNAPMRFEGGVVPEAWLDFNGHMNVGYYSLAFDRALEPWYEHWIDLGGSYARREGMGPFALQSHLHYLRELRRGEAYTLTVQLLDADRKRWRLFLQLVRDADGVVAATCEQLSMNVDLSARRSADLPESQKRRLAEMLAAHRGLAWPDQVGRPLEIRRKA